MSATLCPSLANFHCFRCSSRALSLTGFFLPRARDCSLVHPAVHCGNAAKFLDRRLRHSCSVTEAALSFSKPPRL